MKGGAMEGLMAAAQKVTPGKLAMLVLLAGVFLVAGPLVTTTISTSRAAHGTEQTNDSLSQMNESLGEQLAGIRSELQKLGEQVASVRTEISDVKSQLSATAARTAILESRTSDFVSVGVWQSEVKRIDGGVSDVKREIGEVRRTVEGLRRGKRDQRDEDDDSPNPPR